MLRLGLGSVSASTPRSGGETGKAGGTSAEGASFERRRREHRGAEDAEGIGCGEGVFFDF